ncbi:hypothetical protein BH10ACT3_BH10ACT3_21940 [soil metagenome]
MTDLAQTTDETVHTGPKLFVVFLGGDLPEGRIGEDHEVVFVAATDLRSARSAAKRKWRGSGRAHIDAAAEVSSVDGWDVQLTPSAASDGDRLEVNSTYVR